MPPKKRAASADAARLKVLATADERSFLTLALELLGSGSRLGREAALEALEARPLPAARDALRALYLDLDSDGLKRDQAGRMRGAIVRILAAIGDVRDADIALRACDCVEMLMGDDSTWELRVFGLRLLLRTDPDLFPYVAIERLDDVSQWANEPANTAFKLLAATGNYPPIYQWLLAGERDSTVVAAAFEVLAEGPRDVVRRYAARSIDQAAKRGDEALSTVLAEAIVNRELEDSYSALRSLMFSKQSDELYAYLAMLLAATNRPALLAILEEQLHRGRRPALIEAALRVRSTPEQAAILKRWEDGDEVSFE